MISGFRHEVAKKCSLLGYYAASSGNFLRYLNLWLQGLGQTSVMATKVRKNAILTLLFIYIQGDLMPIQLFLKDARHHRDTKQCPAILYNMTAYGKRQVLHLNDVANAL
jgi:hypothetical protein